MAKRRTYKKKSTYRKKKNGARRRAPKQSVRKLVKREIARAVENKTIQEYDLGFDILPSSAGTAFVSSIHPIGPSPALAITQGVGQAQRIGNRIKLKKLMFKGTIHANPYNLTTNTYPQPQVVKMWLFYDKTFPTSYPDPSLDFFQFGNTVSGFQNDLTDCWAPVNKDRYRVLYTKQWKIGFSAWTPATGTLANYGGLNNNDFHFNGNFKINCLKYIPKTVVYRDNNSDPTSRHLFAMFQTINASGTQLQATERPTRMSFVVDCQYEDA